VVYPPQFRVKGYGVKTWLFGEVVGQIHDAGTAPVYGVEAVEEPFRIVI